MSRVSWFSVLVSLLLCCPALAATAAQDADNPQALVRFFQTKTRSLPSPAIDFTVTGGYAVFQTGNADSSGRYAMNAFNISRVAPEIYRIDISLEKPLGRDVPSNEAPYFFTDKRTYYFWYQNGEQLVFKVGGKRVPVSLGRKEVLRVDIHSPDTYTLNRETMLRNISFTDGPVSIHLQIKFN